MAQITITIPDPIYQRVLNGFAKRNGYSDILINGQSNPETKAQFAKRKLIEFIKNSVRESEIEDAKNAAGTIANASAESEILLT